jgi:hypothetical protein
VIRWPGLRSPIGLPWALALGVTFLGCGKKEADPASLETPEYWKWRQTQLPIPVANFAPVVPGKIVVLPPENRSRSAEDFCEIFFQGSRLHRAPMGKMPSGQWPRLEISVTFLTGPANWIDLWDSSSNRNYRFQVDTREGTQITLSATGEGYEIEQAKSP